MKLGTTGTIALLLTGMILAAFPDALAEGTSDDEAIKQAVLNYVNSVYEMNPKLIDASVHPRLQKVGYAPKKEEAGYKEMWMTHAELKELTAHWNKDGHLDPATAKREVKILDRLDQTAVVRLDAEWGVDYIHLAKAGDKWLIMNVIWQTYPAE